MSAFYRYLVGVAGAATLLAGCGGAASSSGLASALRTFNPGPSAHFHPYRRWVAADIGQTRRLLFVTDLVNQNVDIYAMPALTLKGQVGGFMQPDGECSDNGGNVWVVDQHTRKITKLSHTGNVVGLLHDKYGSPVSCAVDPTTGNLAVTDATGGVVIYAGARGTGMVITNPQVYYYEFDGYDAKGNLWVTGNNGPSPTGQSILSSCNASSCSTIPISGGTIYSAGFVQWVVGDKTWYVADEACDGNTNAFCIYPVSENGALGRPIKLKDSQGKPICAMFQGVITSAKSPVLAGGEFSGFVVEDGCIKHITIGRWSFPAGGPPINDTTDTTYPLGAAISAE